MTFIHGSLGSISSNKDAVWFGLQCNDRTNLTFNHQGEVDDKGNARYEWSVPLNFANGILPREKELVYFQQILHLNCLDLPQHINCKVINEV